MSTPAAGTVGSPCNSTASCTGATGLCCAVQTVAGVKGPQLC